MKKLSIIAFVILCSLNSKAQITVSPNNLIGINNPNPLDALDVIGNPVFGTAYAPEQHHLTPVNFYL